MRIGYLIPEFPGQTHAFFWREMQALESMGAEVTLISTRRPAPGACPHAFGADAAARTTYLFPPGAAALAGTVGRPGATRRMMGYVAGLTEGGATERLRAAALIPSAHALCALAQDRGLAYIHIHSAANAAHLGALAHRATGLRYGVTLHGDLPVYGANHRHKFVGASLLTAVTDPLRAQIADLLPGRTVHVIPMGVDTDRFCPATPLAPGAGPLHIASVARLNPVKGHADILQAMTLLRARGIESRATFLGDGPERAAIEARIAELGLGDAVDLPGAVSEDAVLATLQAAHVTVLASFGHGEAAPVSVMESMAAATPVICTRIGGTEAMIQDGVDGFLVPQREPGAIAERLERLATDPDLYARLSGAARDTARDRFDHRAQARRLHEAIAAVLS